MNNNDRVFTGAEAIALTAPDCDTDQEALTDLLANLLHWCNDAPKIREFDRALDMARQHFEAERDEEKAG